MSADPDSLYQTGGIVVPAGASVPVAPPPLAPGAPPPAATALPPIPTGPVIGAVPADIAWDRLRGRAVLLDFFSLGCRPCIAAMPDLVALQRKYTGRLQILGYHIGRGSPAELAELARKQELDYPVIISPDFADRNALIPGQPFLEAFGSESLPAAALIDPAGKLVAWNLRPADALKKVEELLGVPATPTAEPSGRAGR